MHYSDRVNVNSSIPASMHCTDLQFDKLGVPYRECEYECIQGHYEFKDPPSGAVGGTQTPSFIGGLSLSRRNKRGNLLVISRRVRVTVAFVEEQYVLNIMDACLYSCCSYPACRAHLLCAALHCYLWSGSTIIFRISHNIAIFGGEKNIEHKMCCFDSLYKFCLKNFTF